MKRFVVCFLCAVLIGAFPVTATETGAEAEALIDLAGQELAAIGYDLTGYTASCDMQTAKILFFWPDGESDRIVAWAEIPQNGDPYLLAFAADQYGSISGRSSPFHEATVTGNRMAALSRYITAADPWMVSSVPGDTDGDGKVTSTDARLLLQASVLKTSFHLPVFDRNDPDAPLALRFVDVDGDGLITSTDARLVLQASIKKIDSFPSQA